jgi:membrane-bound lytic murein transglycosylase A
MKRTRFLAALLITIFLAVVALVLWLARPPAPGPLRLTLLGFPDLTDWSTTDPGPALAAFQRSCVVLMAQPPTKSLGNYAGTVADWREPCRAAMLSPPRPENARGFFEHWFVPVRVSAGDVTDGLFTGYYEPLIHASRAKHDRYQTPVYGRPGDLIDVDLGAFRPALAGEHIEGRLAGRQLVPYDTRAQIDAKGLKPAPVLFYADDPVAVFFLHIQGSGRVVFDDGTSVRVAYAGQNGWPYTAIGHTLIAQGALERGKVSLQTIRAWLHAHPDQARAVLESDQSFVFFAEHDIGDPALGSEGAAKVPLTPGASIAVDPRIHPLGAPFFIDTTTPDGKPLRRLFVAQDIGGAIRGPVRADIFFGFGAEAEALAGEMKQSGQLYVLLPKFVATRLSHP